jgi:arylsulfatase A-like enzyme/Tfp pilus assembly protein PilF
MSPNRLWLAAALLALAACRKAPTAVPIDGAPVIVISVDTLRSDHLPAYGYGAISTPGIDALRADSILYQRAYSPCPLTLVAHATMFTGALPAAHGIRDNTGYVLESKSKTVAEVLKSKSYETGGAVSAIVMRKDSGISRGFDFWDDEIDVDPNFLSLGRAQRGGDETREIAEKWIVDRKSKPFFFFLHIYEPHTPYEPNYDADVVAADGVVGRFVDFLKREGIYDRATILFLSDHGEGLNDHGEAEHGILLYRESLQVPLMLKLPKSARKGDTVAAPVALLDVFSTITNEKSEGQSLLAEIKPDRQIYGETYYPRFHFGWSDMHSMISGDNHYIHAPKPELFDLANDPGEKTNVMQENRRAYNALRAALLPMVKAADAPKAIDPEQAKQLAALGYLGSTVATSKDEVLPDPKDHIGKSGRIKDGFTAFHERRYADAVNILSELLRENPRMLDIWNLQAHALVKLGRYPEAIAAAQEGLRLQPNFSQLAVLIANVSIEQQRFEDAEKHARLIEKETPLEAHNLLAQVYLLQKDYARAAAEAKQVAGEKNDRPYGRILLGRIAMEQGRLDEALQHFDAALAMNSAKKRSPIAKLNFFRADCLARMGRAEEAEAGFRAEIAAFPEDPNAYKNLILLYAVEGKNDAATQLIFNLEKTAPTPPSYVAISETLKLIGDTNGARFWAARGLQKYPGNRQLQVLLRG